MTRQFPVFLIVIIVSMSFFLACDKDDDDATPVIPYIPDPIPIDSTLVPFNYLALGDSYTFGQTVDAKDRYPDILSDSLAQDGFRNDSTIILARTGWTTSDLLQAIEQENLQDTFSMVSLLIGVNNQFRGGSIEQYETEFKELLQIAIQYTGGNKEKVFVISIPDYGYTPFGLNRDTMMITQEINEFNALNKMISDDMGISYFDITPISRLGLVEPELVTADNLHPSGKMYQRWVDLMYDDVKSLLEK